MLTRTILAAAAAAVLIAGLADARPSTKKYHNVHSVHSAPLVDVAARAPYPTETMPGTAPGGRGLRASKRRHRGATSPSDAKASPRPALAEIGAGIVRSAKTGAIARVAARYRDRFQAYVDDLEAAGARVLFMGGYRGGPCAPPRHKHPCGAALDVCQLARGVVDGRCTLPSPSVTAGLARRHGLTEGAIWCSTDYGHVEAGASAGGCAGKGPRGLATMTGKIVPRPKAAAKVRHPHVAERGGSRL